MHLQALCCYNVSMCVSAYETRYYVAKLCFPKCPTLPIMHVCHSCTLYHCFPETSGPAASTDSQHLKSFRDLFSISSFSFYKNNGCQLQIQTQILVQQEVVYSSSNTSSIAFRLKPNALLQKYNFVYMYFFISFV